MTIGNQTVPLFAETLPLAISDQGSGRTFLLLHGGAGPDSMSGLARALSGNGRAIVPTHPGFAGQPQPAWCHRVDDLALAYLALLDQVDARDVILVGNSFGGWIAAEMALRNSPRVAGLVLLCAAGIDAAPDGRPIVNPGTLPPADRAAFAFHDPRQFAVVPATPEGLAMMASNQKVMLSYSGEAFMHDPTLRARLAGIAIPSMVIWGESDRIIDVEYGRRYADSIPGARFEVVAEAGHFPHIEKQDRVVSLIGDLVDAGKAYGNRM
ncbi:MULTISPECIES: alpha/beta fold hydrolase [Paraburkholderia]|uniref:alpha/beta fold hydrolase n=1 Tax=Paraburkholderia TaxID=1822464 RepID=UPI0022561DB4|nr:MULTISPECIES: alpha/beta fold hydrolase [Paraburkholderia]MCX4166110.1 alpha/beta fold hydrolase [Paraburkholderia megapolitana]MDN7161600.1 alpha/beta hydrolase [Paraburkholderia sp. CHISQ3]MDQ6498648.1 alpha/beta hydrolase [Paraburkholderia megapolitana]